MNYIKKAWITPWTDNLSSLTIESENAKEFKLEVSERTFPVNPTFEHPLRHTINIGLLSYEDMITLYKTIKTYLEDKNGYVN